MAVSAALRQWAEEAARSYLEEQGWYVRHTWWGHSGQHIDMVCIDRDMTTLLFICLYQQKYHQRPVPVIPSPTQLLPIATTYIHEYHLEHLPPRFDSIVIIGHPLQTEKPLIQHQQHIITLSDPYSIYDREQRHK